jgi:enterochelin esterase family protein
MRTLIFSFTLMLPLLAQAPPAARPPARLVSPEVQSDNKVTFRFRAPNAQKVTVNRESAKPLEMQKDEEGVWTVTTDALEPDMYGYMFNVDGVNNLDPVNPLMKPNLLGASSMVHIHGPSTIPWEVNDVPRGTVRHHFFKSTVANDNRDMYVYTPPNYDPKKAAYPVLYLLHGFSDDASGWTSVGQAHVIFDNLIAQGKVKPMVVVMPLGYGTMEALKSQRDASVRTKSFDGFRDSLLQEVIPQVEKTYHVSKDRKDRAIAGLSMGGAESLRVGLNYLDKFAWIGAFSSGGVPASFSDTFPSLDSKANDKLKLLWIACGKEDGLFEANSKLDAELTQRNVKHQWIVTPGAHTWLVWRRNLAEFTPLLFNSSATNVSRSNSD